MIKDLIKSMLRITDTGPSMIDCVKYPVKNWNGYSGNSLLEKNILFCIKSVKDFEHEITRASQIENFNYSILKINTIEDAEQILKLNSKLGPFDKIVNILSFDDSEYTLVSGNDFNNKDSLYVVYRLLQTETTYTIGNCGDGIATALLVNSERYSVIDNTIENLLKGLGLPLARHQIICNSLTATENVSPEDIVNTLMFLISKYGYELNGETLKLGN